MRVNSEVYPVEGDWHEYRVSLIDDDGHVVDQWDSKFETYNGIESQRLSKEDAEDAVAEIEKSVENGNAAQWFTL